jgi:menaquinone-dependent protoporphyrinogen oxidase
MSQPTLIAFESHDGQTARIAHRLGTHLAARHVAVDVVDLRSQACSPEGVRAVILGAPVRYGRHSRALRRWVEHHRAALNALPSAFFSVSLVAASTRAEDQGAAADLMAGFLRATGWTPGLTHGFAGALRYRQYNPLVRLVMRRIARRSGGDTDTSVDHDYTDWAAVDAFADECAALIAASPAPGKP